jgi:transmembrane sensor
MGQETDERIRTEAARWHARLAADDCTNSDRIEFQRWWARHPRHAAAYQQAEGVAAKLAERSSLDARLMAMADDAFAMGANDAPYETESDAGGAAAARRAPRHARRWWVPASLAATIVMAFVSVRLAGYRVTAAPPITYASSEQSRRDVTLPDGSSVQLDVDSEIRVTFAERRRDIVLVDGRALFVVAKDAARPFVVSAGEAHTTALGTRFQVQREGQQVLVTLTEGAVAVTSDAGRRETLSPGEQISLSTDGQVHEKRAVDAQAVTSWSRGRLAFRNTPLGDALQEVNRYGTRKVRLGDPELADLPVDGNFIAGETESIVSAFVAALPLRVAADSTGEIILFRRYNADVP